jgi:hypothetical protein
VIANQPVPLQAQLSTATRSPRSRQGLRRSQDRQVPQFVCDVTSGSTAQIPHNEPRPVRLIRTGPAKHPQIGPDVTGSFGMAKEQRCARTPGSRRRSISRGFWRDPRSRSAVAEVPAGRSRQTCLIELIRPVNAGEAEHHSTGRSGRSCTAAGRRLGRLDHRPCLHWPQVASRWR